MCHRGWVAVRRIWVDNWQMQCCGEPFALDSLVTWSAVPVTGPDWYSEFLDVEVAASITDHEEHHADDRLNLTNLIGVVRSIDAVFCRYHVVDRTATPIARSGVLEPRTSVDGWEAEDEIGVGRTFVGYLVNLDPA
jgi:hypothetical protein